MWLQVLAISLAISFAIALLINHNAWSHERKLSKKSAKLPPGNMGWPLVGATISFLNSHPPNTLGDFMAKNISTYGKIFKTSLAGKLTVVSADVELNRLVLQNEMKLFEQVLPSQFPQLFGELSMPIVDGDAHKYLRSHFVSFLGSPGNLFFKNIEETAAAQVRLWKDRSLIYVTEEAKKFTFEVIAKKALGMEAGEPEMMKLRIDLEQLCNGFHSFPINLPGTAYKRALKSSADMMDLVKRKFEERKQKMEGGTANSTVKGDDFLAFLMQNSTLSLERIGEMIRGLLFGGFHTTWRAIALAVYFLQGCPAALQQLREEHLQLIRSDKSGDSRELTWHDYKNLQFTQSVVNETLRLGNVAGFLFKMANVDIEFKGFLIPRGVNVMTSFAAVHLDPSLFEAPEQFNPWRWMSSSGIKKTSNLMPFGGGPRLCAGMEIARLEIILLLHHLILSYDWEPAEADHPVAHPHPEFRKGLPIMVRPLPSDSYEL